MDDNRKSGGGRILASWAARLQQRAASFGLALASCRLIQSPYWRRIDKVKFGIPIEVVCKNDIPGPLLVLILKLNKEGPYRKDIFRAPGHHGNMKKLIHFLQHGRLVNLDNYSVYTIASVLKTFLRKLPGGIFGLEGEQQLFRMIDITNVEEQRDQIQVLLTSLPPCTQKLIILLFGTFRVISASSELMQTGMTAEALGVSVAPSFFQTCVSDGKAAKMEDVQRFKVATRIMKFLIDNFGVSNLFGKVNYEYYARITGRILKIDEEFIFSFRFPPDHVVSRQLSLWAERKWLEDESVRLGLRLTFPKLKALSKEECQSTPALVQPNEKLDVAETGEASTSLTMIPENSLLDRALSLSLEENGLFKDSIDRPSTSRSSSNLHMTLDELKAVNHYAESTKSLTFLPEVHERQTARMKTRSEWFLSPSPSPSPDPAEERHRSKKPSSSSHYQGRDISGPKPLYILREEAMGKNRNSTTGGGGSMFSVGAASIKQLIRRSSSKEKDRKLIRRNSSKKKNKENGSNIINGGTTIDTISSTFNNTSSGSTVTTNGNKSKPVQPPPTSPSQLKEQESSTSIVILPPSPSTDSSSNSNRQSNLSGTIDAFSTIVNVSENESDRFPVQGDEDAESRLEEYESPTSPGAEYAEENLSALSLSSSRPPNVRGDEVVIQADVIEARRNFNGADSEGVEPTSSQQLQASASLSPEDCTETNVQTFHITHTYKPRI